MLGGGSRRFSMMSLLVVAALGGCAGSDEGEEYSGVQELVDALEGIGFECEGDLGSRTEVVEGASMEVAQCMVSPPSGDLELAVLDSPGELDPALDAALTGGPDPAVIGKNWFVSAEEEEWATRIVDELGGRLVEPES